MREKADEKSKSLGKYYNGVNVIIVSLVSFDDEFAKVKVGNLEGYMKTAFLSISASSPPSSAMPVMTIANPGSAQNLHLRERQSMSSRSLVVYANGTEVILMGFHDEWAHVIVDGQMGFMLGKYLK